jgi:hypothetical protein
MKETIEVGYKPIYIPFFGFTGTYHKYILYTNSSGEQFYVRGGPESRTETSTEPFPFGHIKTESGEYKQGTLDWDNARDGDPNAMLHPRETIKEGDDLSLEWHKIIETFKDVDDRKVPYDPRSSNSNATVDEALREAGLPAPQKDGPTDYWAPGSDFDLPGGDVPGNSDEGKFRDEFKIWYNHQSDNRCLSNKLSAFFMLPAAYFSHGGHVPLED